MFATPAAPTVVRSSLAATPCRLGAVGRPLGRPEHSKNFLSGRFLCARYPVLLVPRRFGFRFYDFFCYVPLLDRPSAISLAVLTSIRDDLALVLFFFSSWRIWGIVSS